MNSVFRRFCLLQASYWSFQAGFTGYITSYMLSEGMSSAMLSFVVAANLLLSFLGSLYWGRRIDREQANRKYFLLGNAAVLALAVVLYLSAGRQSLVCILYPFFGFMNGFIATDLDAWVIISFPDRRDAAGRSRSFATTAYAFTMLLSGFLIGRFGYGVMLGAAFLFLAISISAALRQPETKRLTENAKEKKRGVNSDDLRQLLRSGSYPMLVLVMFLTGLTIAPLNNMKPVIIGSVGSGVTVIGLEAFIGCMAQVPFLVFSGKILKIPQRVRLMICITAPLLYALLILWARTPAMVILAGIFNNVSFGILFPTYREITETSVDARLRNTAHSIVDVVYGSFSGMIAMTYTGAVIAGAGMTLMALICVCTQVVAIAIAVLSFTREMQPKQC